MSPPREGLDLGYSSAAALICTGFTPTKGPWESTKRRVKADSCMYKNPSPFPPSSTNNISNNVKVL